MFSFFLCLGSFAQTPVERVIEKYESVKGARYFLAKGASMRFARPILKKTPVAPIASDVDEVAVLKMEAASQYNRDMFDSDLESALKNYEYYGKHDSTNGIVDVYILKPQDDIVRELVIYNPELWSLNSLYGSFTVSSLLELNKK